MFHELLIKKNELIVAGACSFFMTKLGITQEERKIITLEEVKNMEPGTGGTCGAVYDPKFNLIRINIKVRTYASVLGMLDVIAHELVHARQHLRGEFYFKYVSTPIFWGLFNIKVLHKFHHSQDLNIVPYYERICEMEAHNLAHEMITEYFFLLKEATDPKQSVEPIVCHI